MCWTYWLFCTFRTPITIAYFTAKAKPYNVVISHTVQLWLLFKILFLFVWIILLSSTTVLQSWGHFYEPPSIQWHDALRALSATAKLLVMVAWRVLHNAARGLAVSRAIDSNLWPGPPGCKQTMGTTAGQQFGLLTVLTSTETRMWMNNKPQFTVSVSMRVLRYIQADNRSFKIH